MDNETARAGFSSVFFAQLFRILAEQEIVSGMFTFDLKLVCDLGDCGAKLLSGAE